MNIFIKLNSSLLDLIARKRKPVVIPHDIKRDMEESTISEGGFVLVDEDFSRRKPYLEDVYDNRIKEKRRFCDQLIGEIISIESMGQDESFVSEELKEYAIQKILAFRESPALTEYLYKTFEEHSIITDYLKVYPEGISLTTDQHSLRTDEHVFTRRKEVEEILSEFAVIKEVEDRNQIKNRFRIYCKI